MTARDLMNDPMTTPYTAEILRPRWSRPKRWPTGLSTLPEVAQAITASSFVPTEQEPKLAILGDLELLLGPTLTPDATLPPPSEAEIAASIDVPRQSPRPASRAMPVRPADSPAAQLSAVIVGDLARGPAMIPAVETDLLTGLDERLDSSPLHRRAAGDDGQPTAGAEEQLDRPGRARPVEVFPEEDARDHGALERFVAAVRGSRRMRPARR